MLKRAVFIVAVLALAAGLLAGILQLCVLRFRVGDVYPPLSSLRGDPVGAKAFHDALKDLDGVKVERNYRPLAKLGTGTVPARFTLFRLGSRLDDSIEMADWQDLLRIATEGNRVVLAFAPTMGISERAKPKTTPVATPKPAMAKSPTPAPTPKAKRRRARKADPEEDRRRIEWITFEKALGRIGIKVQWEPRWEQIEVNARAESPATERALKWHGIAWLETASPRAKVLYRRAKKPVAIECSLGRGSLVLATDSFFITNEALRDERASIWLTALIGGNRKVVFEESHHGVAENSGVATLMRSYRLEGVFGVLALLAALYVWKNASPLLPRIRGAAPDGVFAGRDAQEGFVNLLRRAIPRSQLIAACVEEWNRAFAHQAGRFEPPAAGNEDPVRQYAAIAETLSRKRRIGR